MPGGYKQSYFIMFYVYERSLLVYVVSYAYLWEHACMFLHIFCARVQFTLNTLSTCLHICAENYAFKLIVFLVPIKETKKGLIEKLHANIFCSHN